MHDVGFEARQNETSRTSMEPSRTTPLIKYDRPEHDASDGLTAISSWQIRNMPRHARDKATVIGLWLPRAIGKALTDANLGGAAELLSEWKVDAER
jgi:hypothetical protein